MWSVNVAVGLGVAPDSRFLFVFLPEPEPLPDVLRKDPRPALLHGGPLSRGHEDLDGCDRHRSRGIHTVHELRDTHTVQRAQVTSR